MQALALAVEGLERWRREPLAFVADVWGVELEPFQGEALDALAIEGRVSIRSGHGVGKSTLDAWAVLWFMSTHYPCKVPCTAPTAHQLDDVLKPEIGMWLNRMPEVMQRQFELQADRLILRGARSESFASFRTGNKSNPEALQGFHSENLLFVLDEASGVDDIVFEVAEGALSTPGARVLMTSNPTRRTGYFHDSHHSMRSHWWTRCVPCSASSRVAPEYIERMGRYGEESNVYRVRVLGEFPHSDDDAVMPLDLVESAVHRDVSPIPSGRRCWGVDVARFGDARTALAKRWGNILTEPVRSWSGKDTMQVAGLLLHEFENTPKDEQPADIFVDVIGVGAGVVDRGKEMGLPVRGVNVAESPSISDQFMRYRDELWFAGREWFEGRDCQIPDDSDLIGELTTVGYEITPAGKKQVVSKEKMRRDRRGSGAETVSPDLADAFLLTFAQSRYAKKKRKPIVYDNRGIV